MTQKQRNTPRSDSFLAPQALPDCFEDPRLVELFVGGAFRMSPPASGGPVAGLSCLCVQRETSQAFEAEHPLGEPILMQSTRRGHRGQGSMIPKSGGAGWLAYFSLPWRLESVGVSSYTCRSQSAHTQLAERPVTVLFGTFAPSYFPALGDLGGLLSLKEVALAPFAALGEPALAIFSAASGWLFRYLSTARHCSSPLPSMTMVWYTALP
jgi:hypothetical protein